MKNNVGKCLALFIELLRTLRLFEVALVWLVLVKSIATSTGHWTMSLFLHKTPWQSCGCINTLKMGMPLTLTHSEFAYGTCLLCRPSMFFFIVFLLIVIRRYRVFCGAQHWLTPLTPNRGSETRDRKALRRRQNSSIACLRLIPES